MVSTGPSSASGGITTLTREPSGRRASTIGWPRRRAARAARGCARSRGAARASRAKRDLRRLEPPAPLDPRRARGRMTMTSSTSGSPSSGSSGPRPNERSAMRATSASRARRRRAPTPRGRRRSGSAPGRRRPCRAAPAARASARAGSRRDLLQGRAVVGLGAHGRSRAMRRVQSAVKAAHPARVRVAVLAGTTTRSLAPWGLGRRRKPTETVGVEDRLRRASRRSRATGAASQAGTRDPPSANPAGHLRDRATAANVDEHVGADLAAA